MNPQASEPDMAIQLQDILRENFQFADPTSSDFFFDFSSFELNPDQHLSISCFCTWLTRDLTYAC